MSATVVATNLLTTEHTTNYPPLNEQLVNDISRVGPGHDKEARPYLCYFVDCDKAFARKSDLARHFRIHNNDRTGEKPHHCETCQKAFADSSSLARHRRIHTGKRPYCCSVDDCGRAFARRNTFLKHYKSQHPSLSAPATASHAVRKVSIPAPHPVSGTFLAPGPPGLDGNPMYFVRTPSNATPAVYPEVAGFSGSFRGLPRTVSDILPCRPLSTIHTRSGESQPLTPGYTSSTYSVSPPSPQVNYHSQSVPTTDHLGPSFVYAQGPVPGGGMIYSKAAHSHRSVSARSYVSEPTFISEAYVSEPARSRHSAGSIGGFHAGQLAIPQYGHPASVHTPLHPSSAERESSPDLVDINNVPSFSFQAPTGVNLPFSAVDSQHFDPLHHGPPQFVLSTPYGRLHSAPPTLQRFSSMPSMPSAGHGPYQGGYAHSSGEDENWDIKMLSREHSASQTPVWGPSLAHPTPLKPLDVQCSNLMNPSADTSWHNNLPLTALYPGFQQNPVTPMYSCKDPMMLGPPATSPFEEHANGQNITLIPPQLHRGSSVSTVGLGIAGGTFDDRAYHTSEELETDFEEEDSDDEFVLGGRKKATKKKALRAKSGNGWATAGKARRK